MYTTWDASLQDFCGRIPCGTKHLETLLLEYDFERSIKIRHDTHTHMYVYNYIYIVYLHMFGKSSNYQ